MLELFQLGTGGTSPLANRALSSAAVRVDGKGYLFDVGEGTQKEISKSGLSFLDIDYILITHLHADHIGGLFGLLMAMKEACNGSNNPNKVVTIIGPYKIKSYVEHILSISYGIPFQVKCIELGMKDSDLSLKVGNIQINSCKAKHGVPCFAYNIEYSRKRKFNPEKAQENGIPVKFWKALNAGETIIFDGKKYDGNDFLGVERKGFKISYVADTRPTQELREFIKNSDIAIVEGMYRDDVDISKAKKNFHMTWREVSTLVNKNGIGEVILTHFSPSVIINESDKDYLKSLIPNGTVGYDGLYRDLNYESNVVVSKKENQKISKQYDILMRFLKSKRFSFNKIESISSFKFFVYQGNVKYPFCVYKTTQSIKGVIKNIYSFEGYYIFEL